MDQYSSGRSFKLSGWHIALLLLICFVGLVVLFVLTGKNRLEKEIAAIRAAGYPTNFEELDKYYSIPEGVPNAADLYTKAFDAYQDPNGEFADHLPIRGPKYRKDPRSPLDPNSVKAIISDLQTNQETLEFLDKAAAIEHCRYDLDFSQEVIPNSCLNDIKRCTQLLAEQTMLLAHQNDGGAAVKSITRQLALAQSLKKEPVMLSQLVRMGLIEKNCSSVEYTLNRTTLTDEQLTNLQQRLSYVYQNEPMAMGLLDERCSIIWFIDNPQHLEIFMISPKHDKLLLIPGVRDRNFLMSLKLLGQYTNALKLPAQQRLSRYREIEAEKHELSIFYWLTFLSMPSLEQIGPIDMRIAAQVDCTRVALAIERYRLAKGSLPRELADLVPQYIDKVPINPLDRKPLRYKLTEPGYIVYSIGYDGTDEGGLEKGKRKDHSDPYDWPFIVEH